MSKGSELTELMGTHRWVYWLDQTQPDPECADRFLVCIVVEGEPGFYPMTGRGEGSTPWYWDKVSCRRRNELKGINDVEEDKIVTSSMFHAKNPGKGLLRRKG